VYAIYTLTDTSVSPPRIAAKKGHQASRPTYTAIKGQQLNSCSSYDILVDE
jgi:hypothetical protein